MQATRTCSMSTCQKPEKARGLCTAHYQTESRRGRLDHHPIQRPAVGYHGVHKRLASALGPARSHPCVDCGRQAEEWSYQGGATDEEVSPAGSKFSRDAMHYRPRCFPCHRAYDFAGDTCRRGHSFTPENTYFGRNQRTCRACKNERQRARRSAQSERLAA